jgi:ketopantoate reductase
MSQGNYLEFETMVGEPMREGRKAGVPTPTLNILYELCRAIQWKTKLAKGLVTQPPKRTPAKTVVSI